MQRVHDAGGRVAQQRLHPHAGAEVAHAAVQVPLRGAPVVGAAALVVADPLAHEPRAHEEHRGGGDVEGPVDGVRDVDERLPRDRGVVGPLGDPRHDARHQRAERDEHADDEDELVRLGQLQSTHERPFDGTRESYRGLAAAGRYPTVFSVFLAQAAGEAGEQLLRESGQLEELVERALAELRRVPSALRRSRSRSGGPGRAAPGRRRRRPARGWRPGARGARPAPGRR